MRVDQQTEKFAGQQLLATDPREERPLRLCPACLSDKKRKLGIKNELEIMRCMECTSIYCPYTPWYTSRDYYDSYYEQRFCDEPPIVARRLSEITAEFSGYRLTNRLLDVGCGSGLLLQAARDNGWNAQAVDVSASSVEQVRELGFDVFHGELSEAKFEPGQFDVVTAVELLEHLVDPLKVVSEVHRLLRTGGMFWITTPNVRSLTARVKGLDWRSISPPEHLQLFSIEGLRQLFVRAGFREVRCETTGMDPVGLLRKQRIETPQDNSQALETKYRLNEALNRNRTRRTLKNAVNTLLNLSRLGDSLKAIAIR